MLDDLSNRDATKREQALEQIESAAIASDDELARLFVELTAIDTSNELAASYQALALSILIRIDAAGPHVLHFDGESHRRLKPVLDWWQARGHGPGEAWREDCGWLDSIGHGAELAGAVGQHRNASTAVVAEWATVAARLAQADRRFLASEQERLALAFALLTARAPELLDALEPADLWEAKSPQSPLEPGWESNRNVHTFLCALATIWTFGVAIPEGGINLPPRDLDSVECTWLRRALASTDTSGMWGQS